MPSLTLTLLEPSYSVCRLAPGEAIEPLGGDFSLAVSAPEETTVVCPTDKAPAGATGDHGWRCFRIDQTFAFDVPGILASVLQPLASAGIGIFATSTFSTDYVLVKAERLADAVAALTAAGHQMQGS